MGAIAAVQSPYAGYKRRDCLLARTGHAEGAETLTSLYGRDSGRAISPYAGYKRRDCHLSRTEDAEGAETLTSLYGRDSGRAIFVCWV
jgi:hypothetical protein